MDINMIKRVVSETTGVDLNNENLNKKRTHRLVDVRRMYFDLCKEYTTFSLHDIGKSIKPHKDHATVLYNIRESINAKRFDKVYRNNFENLHSKVQFIKEQISNSEIDFVTALERLQKMEQENERLTLRNQELLDELTDLKDKIKRQNKYLKENGYEINRSIFKD